MAFSDKYEGQDASIMAYGKKLVAVTPADADLPAYKYVLCGETGGTVAIKDTAGTTATLWAVPGQPLQFRPTRIVTSSATLFLVY